MNLVIGTHGVVVRMNYCAQMGSACLQRGGSSWQGRGGGGRRKGGGVLKPWEGEEGEGGVALVSIPV